MNNDSDNMYKIHYEKLIYNLNKYILKILIKSIIVMIFIIFLTELILNFVITTFPDVITPEILNEINNAVEVFKKQEHKSIEKNLNLNNKFTYLNCIAGWIENTSKVFFHYYDLKK